MNKDKAKELCEEIVKNGYCSSKCAERALGKGAICIVCPFFHTVIRGLCGLSTAVEGKSLRERELSAARLFLDGEIVLIDGELYEVSDE